MKKTITYIAIILLITIITVGGTFAFFSATAARNNAITSEAHQLKVIYSGNEPIEGELELVKSKEGGFRREINIGLESDSVGAKANLFIYVANITSTLATGALKWELYQIDGETETHIKSGTFAQCGEIGETKSNCTAGEKVYMLTNFELSKTETTTFAIYIWLDGEQVNNSVLGASVSGYIGAETEKITGDIS